MQRYSIEISWASLWRIFLFLIVASIIYLSRQIILALFFAIVISAGLESIVNFLERYGLPRLISTILIFLIIVLVIVFSTYILIPILFIQLNDLFSNLTKLTNFFGSSSISPSITNIINGFILDLNQRLLGRAYLNLINVSQIFNGAALAIFVFFSAFYLTLSRAGLERLIISVFPPSLEGKALKVYYRVNRKLGSWLKVQIFLSLIVGLLVFVALTILGVKNAALLGFIAAICEIVPYVGPIIAGALSVLSALTVSVPLAIYVLIAIFAIQELEGHILVPILMNRAVSLHPVVVLLSILMGFEIAGILGLIISIPTAVLIGEIIEEYSSTKNQEKSQQEIA